MRRGLFALCLVVAAATPTPSWACGASGGGATGVAYCSLSEHEEQVRKKWRAGAAYSFTNTTIVFDGDLRVDQTRHVALAAIAYRPTRRWTLELGLGSLVAGALDAPEPSEFSPGVATSFSASWRALETKKWRPFVLLTGQASYADAATQLRDAPQVSTERYRALDFRVGALVGWSIASTVAPYVVARAFGGPVFWRYQAEARNGTDLYHYQVGAGLSALIARRVDLYFEGVPFGEQSLGGGVGVAF